MGDDLGDDWVANGMHSDEVTPAAAAVQPTSLRKDSKKVEMDKPTKNRHGAKVDDSGWGAVKKRARAQLSPEGFEDDEEEGDDEEEVDEEARAAEEEAQRVRTEKKKRKLQAFKAKVKAKKKQKIAERAGGEGDEKSRGRGGGTEEAAAQATDLWSKYCKIRGPLVTPLESDHPWITPDCLACVEGFGAHTLAKLVGFIKASLLDWKTKIHNRNNGKAPRGGPSVLIVCAGARRCVEVMKSLAAFRCQVVKLFAKHLKMDEQRKMLRKGCFPLAVGTPGRMHALADAGALCLNTASLLVLDMQTNVKGRDVLTMDGVSTETMRFLAEYARPNLLATEVSGKAAKGRKGNAGQLRIALY